MYLDYFSLKEKPFSITPDPAYLFLSDRHAEALAHLVYGVTDSGGFIQLTGEVGTGKTTIVRSLLEQLPENVDVALVLNPRLTVNEFLHTICDELRIRIEKQSSNKECIDALNRFLLEAYGKDRRVVLLIDEAQNLSVEVLEQVRLLTNLETHKDKLLQIILIGQPELQTLLQRQDLRQLAQRITARYHLRPLNQQESHDYLSHRLSVAGGQPDLISSKAKATIYKAANGIPRLMNVIADRALLGAYSQEKRQVDTAVAKHSIKEVVGDEIALMGTKKNKGISAWWSVPIIMSLFALSWLAYQKYQPDVVAPTVSAKTAKKQADLANAAPSESEKDSGSRTIKETQNNTNKNTAAVISKSADIADNNDVDVEDVVVDVIEDVETVNKQIPLQKSTSLNELLNANIQSTSSEQAFNQLLSTWNKAGFLSHLNACDNLLAYGLRCYFSENQTWDALVKLNRPFIIEIKDAAQEMHQVTIVSVNNSTAQIKLGNQNHEALLDDLIGSWTGKALMFWQFNAPTEYPLMQIGQVGDEVLWLKEKLNSLEIVPIASLNNSNFGPITQKQVMNFQERVGLMQDGVVGVHTFIALNTALNLDVPLLAKGKE